jgi:hypothetical protein
MLTRCFPQREKGWMLHSDAWGVLPAETFCRTRVTRETSSSHRSPTNFDNTVNTNRN